MAVHILLYCFVQASTAAAIHLSTTAATAADHQDRSDLVLCCCAFTPALAAAIVLRLHSHAVMSAATFVASAAVVSLQPPQLVTALL
jgi:hypothetical protein